ncbi:hypothetical protein C5E51_35415 [Nocardia nova]|nr:hypothetical protein C5E51_35415 [Nocardia nova]
MITGSPRIAESADDQRRCAYAMVVRWSTGAMESIRGHARPRTLTFALRQEATLIRSRITPILRPLQPANLHDLREAVDNPLTA